MAFAQKAQTNKVQDQKVKQDPKVDPKAVLKAKVETEPKTEPKVEPKTEGETKVETPATATATEPKILEDVRVPETPPATTSELAPITAPTSEQDRKAEKEMWLKHTPETFWVAFGSQNIRGNVSRAIRHLNVIGLTRSEISKVTGKRYQHVRNVLTEDAKTATK